MTHDQIAVRFYVHADTPVPERRRRVTRRLAELATKGTIDAYNVEFWPKAVSLDAIGDGSNEVLETYEKIQTWAERAGASVTPPFTVVADRWEVTGETDTRLHTPNMCLLVERGEDLVGVFPHERADGVLTLQEGLDALATESDVEIEIEQPPKAERTDKDEEVEAPVGTRETGETTQSIER